MNPEAHSRKPSSNPGPLEIWGPFIALALGTLVVLLSLEVFVRWSGQKGRVHGQVEINTAARWRILAIGHSHTMGLGAPAGRSFPAQLEERLRSQNQSVQVVNMGFGGWNTAQILRELPGWLDRYTPHVVLIWAGDPNFYNPIGLHQQSESQLWDPRQTFRSLNFLSLLASGVGVDSAIGRHEYDPPFGTDLDQSERAMAWAGLIEVGPTDPLRFGTVLNQEIERDLTQALQRDPGHPLIASSYIYYRIARTPEALQELSDLIQLHLLNPPPPHTPSPLMAKALLEFARRRSAELGNVQNFLYWQRWAFEFATHPFRDGDLLTWLVDRKVPVGLDRTTVQEQFRRIVDEVHSTTLLNSGPLTPDPRFELPVQYLTRTSDRWINYRKRQLRLIEANPYSASMGAAQLFREIVAEGHLHESAEHVEERLREIAPTFARTLRYDQDWVSESVTDGLTRMIHLTRKAGATPYLQLYHPIRADFPKELKTNSLIRQVADREGVRSIDPLPYLKKEIGAGSHELIFTNEFGPYDDHLNEIGYRGVAESVDAALQADGVFTKP